MAAALPKWGWNPKRWSVDRPGRLPKANQRLADWPLTTNQPLQPNDEAGPPGLTKPFREVGETILKYAGIKHRANEWR